MCCIFFTFQAEGYSLILASNRDEFLHRATTPAGWHHFDDDEHTSCPILSGIDADPQGGGTWLGITQDGRWAALTNFTEVAPPALEHGSYRSRGTLVRDWLSGPDSVDVQEYAEAISKERNLYPGFNLLIGRLSGERNLAYVTNRDHSTDDPKEVLRPQHDGMPGGMEIMGTTNTGASTQTVSVTRDVDVPSSSMGLSNSVLHEPWPKVRTGRAAFDQVVSAAKSEDDLIRGLFNVMAVSDAKSIQERKDLRCTVLVPPIELPLKKDPSRKAHYATRTSTVLLVKPVPAGEDGKERFMVTFVERDVHVLDEETGLPRQIPVDETSAWRRYDFVTM